MDIRSHSFAQYLSEKILERLEKFAKKGITINIANYFILLFF